MDVLSLFTGSENLYKYLFLGGIGMLVLSVFYPLDKRYELSKEIDSYNYEVKLLNNDINALSKKVREVQETTSHAKYSLTLYKSKGEGSAPEALILRDSAIRGIAAALMSRDEIEKKKLQKEYSFSKIQSLQAHLENYKRYELVFFWGGLLSFVIGIWQWYRIMPRSSFGSSIKNTDLRKPFLRERMKRLRP